MRGLALDLLAVVGVGVFLAGVREVYPPAALMLGGLLLTAGAITAAARGHK